MSLFSRSWTALRQVAQGAAANASQRQSKLIDGFRYDPASQRLVVRLTNGQRREFINVPQPVYQGFVEADSAGDYYQKVLRPNFDLA